MGKLKEIYKLGQLSMFKRQRDILREEHRLVDLFWECTLTCNAACKHCGSSAEKKNYDGELTTEEIFRGVSGAYERTTQNIKKMVESKYVKLAEVTTAEDFCYRY